MSKLFKISTAIGACALLLFSSCQKEQFAGEAMGFSIVSSQGGALDVQTRCITGDCADVSLTVEESPLYSDIATRGQVLTTDKLNSIGVTALVCETGKVHISNYEFINESGIFKYVDDCLWPGDTLDCFLYYPHITKSTELNYGLQDKTVNNSFRLEYQVPSNALYQPDLCIGYTRAYSGIPAVSLKHVLCAISFKVGKNLPVGSTISGISIWHVKDCGTCSFVGDKYEWSIQNNYCNQYSAMTFYPDAFVVSEDSKAGDEIFSSFYMLPQVIADSSDAYIEITSSKSDGSKLTYKFPLKGTTWEKGKIYSYYLNIE